MRKIFKAGFNSNPCNVLHAALEKVDVSAYYTKIVHISSAKLRKRMLIGPLSISLQLIIEDGHLGNSKRRWPWRT